MADLNINNQIDKTSTLKQDILKRIEDTNSLFEKRDNDLLAAVLYRYYDRDNYDGSTITDEDFIGDKKAYLELLASDKEDVQKALAENERVLKEKQKSIKSSIIDLFIFKAKLYVSNQKTINELETELKNRKKQSCKLDELIATGEQETTSLKQDFDQKEAEYKKFEGKIAEIDSKISLIDQKLLSETLSDEELQKLNSEMYDLTVQRASLEPTLTDLNLEMIEAQDKYTIAKNNLQFNKMELNGLDISNYEAKLDTAKKDNEKLLESVKEDQKEFETLGFNVTYDDVMNSYKTPNSNSQQNNTPVNKQPQKAASQPQTQKGSEQQQQQPQNSAEHQSPSTLPTPQTAAQQANSLKHQILNGSDEEIKNLLTNTGYLGVLSTLSNFNNKDRKMLINKIDNLNSPTDVNKLSNVVSALQKNGLCSDINLSNLISSDGKVKDFNNLSNEDIDSLNKFVTDIENNKDFIDDEQLDFLQNNFVNNIRYSSLKQALKPKTFRDLFKSKATKEKDNIREGKLVNLCTTISCIPPKKTEVPSRSSNILNDLKGNTRDTIEPTINSKQPPSEDQPSL